MRYKLFGGSGLRVSELFLGAMTFGEQGGVGAPAGECARILDAYADAGGNVIDTASNYRGGASAEIVGELLQGRRDRFVLSTKYTVSRDRDDPNAAGNHRKNLRLSLETSLRRLRTGYVDIYWVHMWDAGTRPRRPRAGRPGPRREDPLRLHLGGSRLGGLPGQHPGSMARVDRVCRPAGALQPTAPRHRTGTAAHGRDPRARPGRLEPARRRDPVRQVRPRRHGSPAGSTPPRSPIISTRPRHWSRKWPPSWGATPAQVAIAWTRARSPVIHPIIGARRQGQILDNLGAIGLDLPAETVARLDTETRIDLGFPAAFIRDTSPWVFGAAAPGDARTSLLPGEASQQRKNEKTS